MTPDEKWLPVVGYEGVYEVSDQGRVRSLDRTVYAGPRAGNRLARGKVLAPSFANHGYPSVGLFRDSMGSTRLVHTLVAEAFIGPRPEGFDVRHLDGDKTNPRASNLAYGTRAENIADAIQHGTARHGRQNATACIRGHEFDEANTYVNPAGTRQCRTCHRDRERAARARSSSVPS